MTVNAVNNLTGTYGAQGIGAADLKNKMDAAMAPVAKLFNESPEQLMPDLRSGKTSLSALAQSKGISQADLMAAIKEGLQQSSAANGQTLSDTQLTNMATTIANRVHHGHHHRGCATAAADNAAANGTQPTDADGDHDGSNAAGGSTKTA